MAEVVGLPTRFVVRDERSGRELSIEVIFPGPDDLLRLENVRVVNEDEPLGERVTGIEASGTRHQSIEPLTPQIGDPHPLAVDSVAKAWFDTILISAQALPSGAQRRSSARSMTRMFGG